MAEPSDQGWAPYVLGGALLLGAVAGLAGPAGDWSDESLLARLAFAGLGAIVGATLGWRLWRYSESD